MRTYLRSKASLLFLTIAVLLAVPAVAFATDVLLADADVLTTSPGVQSSRNLSVVAPGATVTPDTPVDFYALCDNGGANGHFNANDVVNLDENGSSAPSGGSIVVSDVNNVEGSTSSSWPNDGTNCNTAGLTPGVSTSKLSDSTTVKITAPKKAGTHTYTAKWNVLRPTSGLPAGTTPTTTNELSTTTVQAQFTLTVNNFAPEITAFNGDTSATEGQTKTYTISATDTNEDSLTYSLAKDSGTATVDITDNGGGSFDVEFLTPGSLVLKATADDQTGTANATDTETKSVTVDPADSTPPTLNLPADITQEATGASGNVVTYSATADDANPAHPTVTCSPASGSTFAIGTTTVNCEATDAAGNKATGSFKVTVQDTTAPVISGTPSDITKEATGPNGAVASWTAPTASDVVDGSVSVNCESASGLKSGDTFPLGSTTVTCTATDAHGNTSTKTFTVKVEDTTPPAISGMPTDITKEATGANGATVSWTAPTASDVVDGSVNVNCESGSGLKSGDTFPLGTTEVTCSATDNAGNSSSESFNVTVEDTTPPVISGMPTDITKEATGANGATVSWTAPTASDVVDGSVNVNCESGSGLKSGDTFPLGTTEVTCSATDNAGNSSSESFNVTVEDKTPPAISGTPSNITKEATDANGATVSWTAPTASDVVDGSVSVECKSASGLKSGDTFPLGTTEVTCSATDNAGNSSSESFNVTVEDTTGPVLTLPADKTVEATSAAGATVNFASEVSANDAVTGSRPVTCSPASGATFPLGPTTVNCSANDGSGNSSTGSFKVTVQDTTAPVIATHLDVTATATSNAGATVTYSSPATSDAVDGAKTATCTPASGTHFAVGSTTVTCNATDAAGNHATPTTFKVNVSYAWSGFLQPINTPTNMAPSPYTQSVFKIGSTVPVKFQLTGASAGITNGNFYLKYIRTGNGDGLGETEVVAAATGNTGTQFRYDATAGQYIFNWSTKGLSPAGNYEVRVYTDPNFTNLLGSQSIELKK